MSCFVHDPEHFRAIVARIVGNVHLGHGSEGTAAVFVRSCLRANYVDEGQYRVLCSRERAVAELAFKWAAQLMAAERYAYDQRYSESVDAEPLGVSIDAMSKAPMRYVRDVEMHPAVVLCMALSSVDYQCAEGDTHETEPHASALRVLREFCGQLAMSLVHEHRDWNKSGAWDWSRARA